MSHKILRLEFCGLKDNVDDASTYTEISLNCRAVMRDALRRGDLPVYAYASLGLAESSRRDGDIKQAEGSQLLSLKIFTEIGNITGLGRVYWSIGNLLRQESRYAEALRSLSRAYQAAKASNDELCALYSLSGIAETTRILGLYNTSFLQHKQCLSHYIRIGDYRGIVWAFEGMAQIYKNMGRYHDGLRFFSQAKEISQATGDYRGLGYALKGIGECQLAIDSQTTTGSFNILMSYTIFESLSFRIGCGYAKKSLGDSHVIAGDIPEAAKAYKEARDIFHSIKNLRGLAYVFLGLSEISFLMGDLHCGIYQARVARSYFKSKSLRYGLWKSQNLLKKWIPCSYMMHPSVNSLFEQNISAYLLSVN